MVFIYLADDTKSKSSKLLLHGNLGLAIGKRPESLQKLVHTLVEEWKETFEVASIVYIWHNNYYHTASQSALYV